jgi:hypothetical protein
MPFRTEYQRYWRAENSNPDSDGCGISPKAGKMGGKRAATGYDLGFLIIDTLTLETTGFCLNARLKKIHNGVR